MLPLAQVEHDITVALITSVTAILVVTLPLLIQQRRTHRRIDDVYAHVNNVEDNERLPGDEPITLGQAVRQVRDEEREGFRRNDDDHREMKAHIGAVQEAVRNHTDRINTHRHELDELWKMVENLPEVPN